MPRFLQILSGRTALEAMPVISTGDVKLIDLVVKVISQRLSEDRGRARIERPVERREHADN